MSCSIIIPTYNRKKFEKLIEFNIIQQTYRYIIEVLIADDGDESETLQINIPYPVKYIRCQRTTIGNKRNILVNEAKGEYIAHFDTDDIYFPQFIESSIKLMNEKNKNAVGTSDMIFIFKDGHKGGMRNPYLSMANEATLVYKKSFWEKKQFSVQQTNEGIYFLEGRHWEVGHSNINNVMICLCHEDNTVNKEIWRQPNDIVFPNYNIFKPLLKDLGFHIKEN
jgi:glycosyltransferase involved in cell wall biosynthesis